MKYSKYLVKSIIISTLSLSACSYLDNARRGESLKEKTLEICNSVDKNGRDAWKSYTKKEGPYYKARDKAISFDPSLKGDFYECDAAFLSKKEKLSESYKKSLRQGLSKISKEMKCSYLSSANESISSGDYKEAQILLDIHNVAKKRILKASETKNIKTLLQNFPKEMKIYSNKVKQCVSNYKIIYFKLEAHKSDQATPVSKKISLAKNYGYHSTWNESGISGIVKSINQNDLSVKNAKSFLIKKNNKSDKSISIDQISGNMVIYSNKQGKRLSFAIKMEKGKFYKKNSPLNGKYFAITEVTTLTMNGKKAKIAILKKVNIK